MRVPEAVPQLESQPEDWFGSSFKSTTKLWRLPPWYLHRLQPAENQVNLLLLLLQEQGDIILASTLETRYTTARNTLRSLANWKSTSCAFAFHTTTTTTTSSQPEGPTTSLQSLFVQTTMEPLPHGLWSRSSESLTGRTGLHQTEGRFSLLETQWKHHYTGDITTAWNTGILHWTRTHRTSMTCLVGYTPLRLLHPAGHTTTRHFARHLAGDRLRIDSSHRTGHQDYTGHQHRR